MTSSKKYIEKLIGDSQGTKELQELKKENQELKQANEALIKTLKIIKQCIENSTNIQQLMEAIMENVSKEVLKEVNQDEQS